MLEWAGGPGLGWRSSGGRVVWEVGGRQRDRCTNARALRTWVGVGRGACVFRCVHTVAMRRDKSDCA